MESTPGLCLKAFTYCVGQNELFNALWDLDIVDKVGTAGCAHYTAQRVTADHV